LNYCFRYSKGVGEKLAGVELLVLACYVADGKSSSFLLFWLLLLHSLSIRIKLLIQTLLL